MNPVRLWLVCLGLTLIAAEAEPAPYTIERLTPASKASLLPGSEAVLTGAQEVARRRRARGRADLREPVQPGQRVRDRQGL